MNGDCDDEDRWRRPLDDDDLERKNQAWGTGEVFGEMTNLDDEDEEHQMEKRLWEAMTGERPR